MRLHELFDLEQSHVEEDTFQRVNRHGIRRMSEEAFREFISSRVGIQADDLSDLVHSAIYEIIDTGKLTTAREGLLATILDQAIVFQIRLDDEANKAIFELNPELLESRKEAIAEMMQEM